MQWTPAPTQILRSIENCTQQVHEDQFEQWKGSGARKRDRDTESNTDQHRPLLPIALMPIRLTGVEKSAQPRSADHLGNLSAEHQAASLCWGPQRQNLPGVSIWRSWSDEHGDALTLVFQESYRGVDLRRYTCLLGIARSDSRGAGGERERKAARTQPEGAAAFARATSNFDGLGTCRHGDAAGAGGPSACGELWDDSAEAPLALRWHSLPSFVPTAALALAARGSLHLFAFEVDAYVQALAARRAQWEELLHSVGMDFPAHCTDGVGSKARLRGGAQEGGEGGRVRGIVWDARASAAFDELAYEVLCEAGRFSVDLRFGARKTTVTYAQVIGAGARVPLFEELLSSGEALLDAHAACFERSANACVVCDSMSGGDEAMEDTVNVGADADSRAEIPLG